MIELAEAQGTEQQTNGAVVVTEKKKRGRKPSAKKVETREVQRIGIELSDEVSVAVEAYCVEHPLLQRSVVRDAVREKARRAAESAVLENVDEIVRTALFG